MNLEVRCAFAQVLKACPMPNTNQNDDSDPELLNDSGEGGANARSFKKPVATRRLSRPHFMAGVVALNASPTGWKRFVRPLANCALVR